MPSLATTVEPTVRNNSKGFYCHLAVSAPGKLSHVKKALTWGLLKTFTSGRKSNASVALCHLYQCPGCFIHDMDLVGAVGRASGKVSHSCAELTTACQPELSHCLSHRPGSGTQSFPSCLPQHPPTRRVLKSPFTHQEPLVGSLVSLGHVLCGETQGSCSML